MNSWRGVERGTGGERGKESEVELDAEKWTMGAVESAGVARRIPAKQEIKRA